MIITKLETGVFTAVHDGKRIGGIWSDQPAGGINQGTKRHYSARFYPHQDSEGLQFAGTLKECKTWLGDCVELMEAGA